MSPPVQPGSRTLEQVVLSSVERVGTHSHIRGLGLTAGVCLEPSHTGDGLVGQKTARRACGIIAEMVKRNKIAGRGILLAGRPGTGKTALAMGLAKTLGEDIPFVHLSASEIFSLELSKTEVLTQALRRAMLVKSVSEREVIEGEIVELEVSRSSQEGGTARMGRITLRTTDMESIYELGPKAIASLEELKATAGDVISIDQESNKIRIVGRSIARAAEYDTPAAETKFVQIPSGELQRKKRVEVLTTLHDIDVVNSRVQGFQALFAGDTGEIKAEVREIVDRTVAEQRETGESSLIQGVIFIDEAHMLDLECFAFLNRAIESENAPVLILASNRSRQKVRGSNIVSSHGIPVDFLDRLLIVPTSPYDENDTRAIIDERISEEDVSMSEEARELLTRIAKDTSLRYALQLISLAELCRIQRKASGNNNCVSVEDVSRVYKLFLDVGRSVEYIKQYESELLYNVTKTVVVNQQHSC